MLYQLSYVGPIQFRFPGCLFGGQGGIRTPVALAPGLQPGPFNRSGTYPILTDRTHEPRGADDGTRTRNLLFTKQLLCQLSYVGIAQYRGSGRMEVYARTIATSRIFGQIRRRDWPATAGENTRPAGRKGNFRNARIHGPFEATISRLYPNTPRGVFLVATDDPTTLCSVQPAEGRCLPTCLHPIVRIERSKSRHHSRYCSYVHRGDRAAGKVWTHFDHLFVTLPR